MGNIEVKTIIRAGLKVTYENAGATGDEFSNEGTYTFFQVKNAASGTIDVTFITQKTVDGQAVDDRVVAVPTSEDWMIGPFPTDIYNTANKRVQVTYSPGATGVTVAALKNR